MSLLKQIEDKGAVLEWSPVAQYANMVALGTKVRVLNCVTAWLAFLKSVQFTKGFRGIWLR
jgi:hypothetical protein